MQLRLAYGVDSNIVKMVSKNILYNSTSSPIIRTILLVTECDRLAYRQTLKRNEYLRKPFTFQPVILGNYPASCS